VRYEFQNSPTSCRAVKDLGIFVGKHINKSRWCESNKLFKQSMVHLLSLSRKDRPAMAETCIMHPNLWPIMRSKQQEPMRAWLG
jgi:hypothetical protein